MAAFRKLSNGRWEVQIARKGVRKSKTFDNKTSGRDWANHQEYLALQGDGPAAAGLLRDLFLRYAKEQSPKKRGARWEILRLEKICKDPLADVALRTMAPIDFANWRDRRLQDVGPATVKREMVLMSAALNVARREWGLIKINPISDVRKPSEPPPRDRRVSHAEIENLLIAAGCDLDKKSARAVHAFLFAIETAMRAGEIVGLDWSKINYDTRVAGLSKTKNGTAREVPLTSRAVELLKMLNQDGATCFELNGAQVDALFRKMRDKVGIKDLKFHDSRHEAITRLAKKLDVLSLARMVGHKDIRMLQIYYNETAAELALRLD